MSSQHRQQRAPITRVFPHVCPSCREIWARSSDRMHAVSLSAAGPVSQPFNAAGWASCCDIPFRWDSEPEPAEPDQEGTQP